MHRILALFAALPLLASQEPKHFPDTLARDLLGKVKSSTVLIMIRGEGGESSGSGFIVGSKGHIVTNRHVVEGGSRDISVFLNSGTEDQKKLKAEKILVDSDLDLALLKIEGEDLPTLSLGDPADLSETVTLWAFGYPFGNLFRAGDKGPEITVNKGTVTALRKGKTGRLDGIQTDTQVNRGNSGGPLVGGDGLVYGIITSALGDSSLRFAIPSDAVTRFLGPKVVRHKLEPSELGVSGGRVVIEAEIQESVVPAEKVTALIESGGSRKEVEFERGDKKWTAAWDCPELTAEERNRIEASITFRDQTVKAAVFKGGPLSVKTSFGVLSIPAADLQEIRFGESGKPDRIVFTRGSIEGRIEPRHLEAGEKLDVDRIQSARFETMSGRSYQVRIRVKAGKGEATTPASTLAVGIPAPRFAAPSVEFEARMAGDVVEKKMPAPIECAKLAGGGRYLVLHFKELGTLGVFDLERMEFAKHIQLQPGLVHYAAGRSKVLVCYPDKSRLERWNLETFEREITVESPFQGTVTNAELGWNSDGPAVLRVSPAGERTQSGSISLLDIEKMKVLEIDPESSRYAHMSTSSLQIRVGASGSHFTWWRTGSSPSGIGLSRIGDGKIEHKYAHSGDGGFVLASEDGMTAFSSSGIFEAEDLTMTGGIRRRSQEQSGAVLPLIGGPFYLSLQRSGNMGGAGAEPEARGTLCLMGNRQKIVTLDFPVLDRWVQNQWQAGDMTQDRRIWIFPRAKLFVGIPTTNDRLVCRRLDVDQLLDRAGIDYMFVASMPPTGAQAGKEWVYPVAVKSRKGGVKIKLETAPDGMKKDRDETLRWVPKEAGTSTVILLVSDASGQEVYHSFKVVVR